MPTDSEGGAHRSADHHFMAVCIGEFAQNVLVSPSFQLVASVLN